jgi:hypothetical protein
MRINLIVPAILLLTIVLACFNLGLAQSSKRVSVQETKELFELISKDDEEVREFLKESGVEASEAAKAMGIKKVDLNKDGQAEYIVVLNEEHLCGALANCPTWVYRRKGSEYQLLLRDMGRDHLLEKTSTNKYLDLRLNAGDTASRSFVGIYKYDGSKYQAMQCYELRYRGKKTMKVPVKCEENN